MMPCSKGMRACYAGCLHRALVSAYHDARDARDALREKGEGMQMEDDEFAVKHPPVLFKDWLIAHAKPRHETAAREVA